MSPLALNLLQRALVIGATSLLAACASTTSTTEPAAAPAAPATKPAAAAKDSSADSKAVTTPAVAARGFAPGTEHRDPNSPLAKRAVFFDFDQYNIKPEFQELLKAHAAHLNKHQSLKLLVQGSADERGSREYNLALGQKRADAVRGALGSLGVTAARIETVSLGEEKPKASGHDETSWAQNRRGDVLYSGEY